MITRLVRTFILPAMLAVPALFQATPALAADYKIDPSHAFIQFRVSHLGFSVLAGRFNTFDGAFTWDQSAPGNSAIEVTVETASIDSNWAERDKHLRGADFLDVEKFPKAVFKGTKYTGDAKGGKLEGTLTMRGVTKPMVLDVEAVGEGNDPWGGYRAGFKASATLRFKDYGIEYNLGPTAETMAFDLYVEGIRQ